MTSTSSQRFARADPGTFVWASSSIEGDGRRARDDRVGVHLLDDDAAVLDPPARARSRGRRAARACGAGRAPPRSRPRGPCRGRPGGGPPRASGRSCRPRAPSRGRSRRRPRVARRLRRIRASISSAVGRTSSASRSVVSRAHRVRHCSSPSRSRLSSRTLTRGWPRKPRSGCSVWRATAARTASGEMPARRRRRARPGTRPRPG